MTPAARISAAIEVLDEIIAGQAAEQALTRWARRSRFAGSKDRAAVRDHVFDALRHWRSDAALGGGTSGRERMIGRLRALGSDTAEAFSGVGHAPTPLSAQETSAGAAPAEGAEALDVPDWIWDILQQDQNVDAGTVALEWQSRAPVTLRANGIERQALAGQLLSEGIETQPNSRAAMALTVTEGARRLRLSQAFVHGKFEMQDASSQAVVEGLPDAATVLDYCAGGGGKSLALAARGMTVTAHDIDPGRMRDLPERAERAGVRVALTSSEEIVGKQFDIVLCDAPCSGSGAWRRQPEAKWTLTRERLDELQAIQGEILDNAMPLVAEGGLLVFSTCSIFSFENEAIVEAFVKRHRGWTCRLQQRWSVDAEGDGFFATHLTRES